MTRLLASRLAGERVEGFERLLKLAGQPDVAGLDSPPNGDAAIASAIMLAGVIYLILLYQSGDRLFEINVGDPEGMNRLLKVVSAMASTVLEPKVVNADL